jgi:hypothetical protein
MSQADNTLRTIFTKPWKSKVLSKGAIILMKLVVRTRGCTSTSRISSKPTLPLGHFSVARETA